MSFRVHKPSMEGRRSWMKMEKMDKAEDKGKKEIFQDNEKSNIFWFLILRQHEFLKYNAILWNYFKL